MPLSSGKEGVRADSGGYVASGFQMIRSIDLENFRCYRKLHLDGCERLNVIVGDNGSGKTALLEGMFLALCSGTEVALRLRQLRGLEGQISGQVNRIMDALWGDFFYNNDFANPVVLKTHGDGEETRSLVISKGSAEKRLELNDLNETSVRAPVTFTWTDHTGKSYPVEPRFEGGQLTLPSTGEDLPNFFSIGSLMATPSSENAARFSELSRQNRESKFVDLFLEEYDWITGLNIEVIGGAPAIFASVKGLPNKQPITNLSGGINRTLGILLAIASRPRSVVLVDEIENGTFYRHHAAVWRMLIRFMREFDSQLFVSTHSKDCLDALVKAAGSDVADIALWRVERSSQGQPDIQQFSGKTLRSGVEHGVDARSSE